MSVVIRRKCKTTKNLIKTLYKTEYEEIHVKYKIKNTQWPNLIEKLIF